MKQKRKVNMESLLSGKFIFWLTESFFFRVEHVDDDITRVHFRFGAARAPLTGAGISLVLFVLMFMIGYGEQMPDYWKIVMYSLPACALISGILSVFTKSYYELNRQRAGLYRCYAMGGLRSEKRITALADIIAFGIQASQYYDDENRFADSKGNIITFYPVILTDTAGIIHMGGRAGREYRHQLEKILRELADKWGRPYHDAEENARLRIGRDPGTGRRVIKSMSILRWSEWKMFYQIVGFVILVALIVLAIEVLR